MELSFWNSVICPPRYKQEWSMTVSPANMQVEAYLKEHLKDYFIPNFTLVTRKEFHKKADTGDEISAFYASCLKMFGKNTLIMKQAAQAGNVPGYTIRWYNLNVDGTDADFTYTVE